MVRRADKGTGVTAYTTPRYVYNEIIRCFGPFDIDGAADSSNHLEPIWFGPDSPTLTDTFQYTYDLIENKSLFINPPYKDERRRAWVEAWVDLASDMMEDGARQIIMLLPDSTETNWFKRHIFGDHQIKLPPSCGLGTGRIQFDRPPIYENTPAPIRAVLGFTDPEDDFVVGLVEKPNRRRNESGSILLVWTTPPLVWPPIFNFDFRPGATNRVPTTQEWLDRWNSLIQPSPAVYTTTSFPPPTVR